MSVPELRVLPMPAARAAHVATRRLDFEVEDDGVVLGLVAAVAKCDVTAQRLAADPVAGASEPGVAVTVRPWRVTMPFATAHTSFGCLSA
jgi:hypothetical protein